MIHTKSEVNPSAGMKIILCVFSMAFLLLGSTAWASSNPFDGGWSLDLDRSMLTFQSIKEKDGIVKEVSSFATYSGSVDEEGNVQVTVELNSVDTKVDIRNVRMRFLFFETFKYPQATISAVIDKELMEQLMVEKRLTAPINFELNLHGVTNNLQTNAVFTLFTDSQVSVASVDPVTVLPELHGLEAGIAKLQEAAGVTIVPTSDVSFDFVFQRNSIPSTEQASPETLPSVAQSTTEQDAAESIEVVANIGALAETKPAMNTSVALESAGDFSEQECKSRFEVLSQTGAVYFQSGSSELDEQSYPLLQTALDIIQRCPELNVEISGHTDSLGDEQFNQYLSVERANSVRSYLLNGGISDSQLKAVGYGESSPVASNDTSYNRSRNRRIEFNAY